MKQENDVFTRMVRLASRGPIGATDLCNRLALSPAALQELLDKAIKEGASLHVEHDHVGLRPTVWEERVHDITPMPVVGEPQIVGVISDTHLGSKYCLRQQLKDFVHHAYSCGVREILHPGDVLDGNYKHGIWELTHHGLDEQADDLFDTLPQLPGLSYHAITGNHDGKFTDGAGLDIGRYLEARFAAKGRNDLKFYGNRGAYVRVRGAKIHLWHPCRNLGRVKSYPLQVQVERYSGGEKPQILLAGHWHSYCHVSERGVHAISCPTFQGGGSAFGRSLGGSPSIGGLLLSWTLTEHGTIRDFACNYRQYFEGETYQDVGGKEAGWS